MRLLAAGTVLAVILVAMYGNASLAADPSGGGGGNADFILDPLKQRLVPAKGPNRSSAEAELAHSAELQGSGRGLLFGRRGAETWEFKSIPAGALVWNIDRTKALHTDFSADNVTEDDAGRVYMTLRGYKPCSYDQALRQKVDSRGVEETIFTCIMVRER